MVDFDKDGLGDVGSDEAAVAAVVQAFQTGAANAGKLRSCLIQRLFEGHLPRLTAIARTRLREQAKTDDPDNVASDVITKFCEKLASRTGEPVENVAAFLTAMTKHACDDCPGPPPLPPDGRRPAPIDPTEAESLLEAECHLYFSIMALEPTLREMLLIDVGWHTGFNKRHGGPPRRRGDTPAVAEFLGIKTPTVTRWRKRAKEALKKLKEATKTRELIQLAFEAAMKEVKHKPGQFGPWLFSPAISCYAVRLVRLAAKHGLAKTDELLRTAAELDYQGAPQEAIKLADDLEKLTRGKEMLALELRLETAMFMDHRAREMEREERLPDAIDLVERGLRLLHDILASPDADRPPSYRGIHWRAQYQTGVLTRRAYELRQARDPGSAGHAALLRQAREVFKGLLLSSDAMDCRIAAAHQDAVCELLLGNIDEAETGFRRCLKARDEYDETAPGRERVREMQFRRAYEHRRLLHVLAQRAAAAAENSAAQGPYYQQAIEEFKTAVEISADCGFNRYVSEVQQDARDLLPERFREEIDSFAAQHVR